MSGYKKVKIKIFSLLIVCFMCVNLSYAEQKPNENREYQVNEKLTPDYIEQNLSNLNIIKSGKQSSYTPQIRQAIRCYKTKNYTSCLQILKEVEKKEPYNSVVTYYLGLTNLKLGNKDTATNYFKSTSLLDPESIVGKYAKQTIDGVNNPEALKDIKIENDEISNFIQSGKKVAPEVVNKMSQQRLNAEKEEINSNIKKETEELKRQQLEDNRKNTNNVSSTSTTYPTNDEIAQAVKTFQKLGLNPFNSQPNLAYNQMNSQQQQQMQSINNDMMQLSMLMGQANNNSNNSNMMNMLPFMMMSNNNQNSNFKMTPEMIQTMMMSQMMPNLDFNMNNNNRN